MKIHDVRQGSAEWLEARLGIPTASRFSRILTPATRKYSVSTKGLINELLVERTLGVPLDGGSTVWTSRGSDMEAEAVAWYEFERDVVTEVVGFVTRDDGKVGCSPDRFVGEDGGLEIKCPAASNHMGYLIGHDEPAETTQVQGNLWLTERQWWDVVSYCRGFPPVLIRHQRDDKFIEALSSAVDRFVGELETAWERLQNMQAGRIELGDDEPEWVDIGPVFPVPVTDFQKLELTLLMNRCGEDQLSTEDRLNIKHSVDTNDGRMAQLWTRKLKERLGEVGV